MTNLLFPTDFSANNTVALDWVRLFARKTGATIILLHVYQPMIQDSTLPTIGDPGIGLVASQEIETISREQINQLAATLLAEGFSVDVEWRIGSVDDTILEVATERSADLILMGRSEVNTFFDRLAGSAVSDVADESICPVLIIPTAEGHTMRPVEVHTIAYAMQPQTTQAEVTFQTESLVDAFDAKLVILTDDKLDDAHADLIVMQLAPKAGFLDNLLHPNHTTALVEKSDVPVLVYHDKK